MNLVEVRGLSVGYGAAPVVRDLDLVVAPGEVVALLGPNGAGKTTTLCAISGLLPISEGSITIEGHPVRTRRPHLVARAGVAHVPEDRALFYGLTVRENLRIGCRGTHANEELALEFFPGLRGRLGVRAGLLSGGEQQMLALARALCARPKLLMIDEMSLGLAPLVVEQLLPIIRRMSDELDAGVLLVEQHVDLALGTADRAYVLSRGELAVEGAARDLLERREILEVSYLGGAALES